MKGLLIVCLVAGMLAVVGVAFLTARSRDSGRAGPARRANRANRANREQALVSAAEGAVRGAGDADVERLSQEVQRLSRELDELRRARDDREPANLLRLPEAPPAGVGSPVWYLEQYVASFAQGGEGAEYFRLAVDAYAPRLVDELGALVADPNRPLALRKSLVGMLATERFRGDARVVDAFLAALRTRSPERLLTMMLHGLLSVATESALPQLEAVVFDVPGSVRAALIDGLLNLAGARANESLLRLLRTSNDDATSALFLTRVNASDLDAALAALVLGSQRPPSVRMAAAQKVREFPMAEFRSFVADWLTFETDERVRAMLDAAEDPPETPPWHAMRATGPPDASADKDDPNAWATKLADDGEQWLELRYDPPLVATSLRIHEVNSAGAVSEVLARSESGPWTRLWFGEDPTEHPGPFLVTFETTPFAVRDVRIVLDTDRRSGWNEVDAVELTGPSGSAFAVYARASSTYGQ